MEVNFVGDFRTNRQHGLFPLFDPYRLRLDATVLFVLPADCYRPGFNGCVGGSNGGVLGGNDYIFWFGQQEKGSCEND